MEDPMKCLYKLKPLRGLEECMVFTEEYLPHAQETLVAVKLYNSDEDGSLKKAEFYLDMMPATFLTVKAYMGDGRILKFSTGSGNPSDYLDVFLPLLEKMGNDMVNIREVKKVE